MAPKLAITADVNHHVRPSRHRPGTTTLYFDKSLVGFARWARRRLELLGYRVEVCPHWLPQPLFEERALEDPDGVLVTRRLILEAIYRERRVASLHVERRAKRRHKYESLYTSLARKLHVLAPPPAYLGR